MHEKFRLGLKKWLYPGDNNSIATVIGMAKKKKKNQNWKIKVVSLFLFWYCINLKVSYS